MLNKLSISTLLTPAAICMLLSGSAMANPFTSGWQTIAPPAAGFSVQMPCTPQDQRAQATTDNGPTEMHIYSCAQGSESYAVSAINVGFKSQAEAQQVVANIRDQEVKNTQGHLTSEKDVTMGGFPGKMITIKTGEGKIMTSLILATNQKLYQVIYAGDTLHSLVHAPSYTGSFHLTQQ